MPERTAVVVASGAAPDAVAAAPEADLLVAADGGILAVTAAGRVADMVVGDADSADEGALAAAARSGAVIRRHPVDKDESDLELALDAACAAGAARIHVVADDGGRLDHQLANLAVLASPRWNAEIDARIGPHRVWVVRRRRELPLAPGDPLALQPMGGPAEQVRTGGLRYPLAGETLDPLAARGIANEVVAVPVWVSVERGVLLVINSPTRPTAHGAVRS